MIEAFKLIRRLSPANTIIHVGAGTGQGELHQWHTWGVPRALLVDATPDRLAWAEPLVLANPGWQLASAVVADSDTNITFHKSNNPAEDGLIPAEQLRDLWRNLLESERQQRHAQRLDVIFASTRLHGAERANAWLLIDCFPAGRILRGAIETLTECDVVCARVLLKSFDGVHDADLDEITALMKLHGFQWIDTHPSLHPAIGHAVYLRDWPQSLQMISRQVAIARDAEAAVQAELLAQRSVEVEIRHSAFVQCETLTE